MNTIRKTVLSIVILHYDSDKMENYTLAELLDECDTGSMIRGSATPVSSEILSPDAVAGELEAIGNDGTFFDYDAEDCD